MTASTASLNGTLGITGFSDAAKASGVTDRQFLILSAQNSCTGLTTVNGGTLRIDGAGNINSSGGVALNGGAFHYNGAEAYTGALTVATGSVTLGGTNWNGSLGGLTIGAGAGEIRAIAPGNSVGEAVTTGETWASGGEYRWELSNATGVAGGDGGVAGGWDLLTLSGALDITATALDKFTIAILSLTPDDADGLAAHFDPAGAIEQLRQKQPCGIQKTRGTSPLLLAIAYRLLPILRQSPSQSRPP